MAFSSFGNTRRRLPITARVWLSKRPPLHPPSRTRVTGPTHAFDSTRFRLSLHDVHREREVPAIFIQVSVELLTTRLVVG